MYINVKKKYSVYDPTVSGSGTKLRLSVKYFEFRQVHLEMRKPSYLCRFQMKCAWEQ